MLASWLSISATSTWVVTCLGMCIIVIVLGDISPKDATIVGSVVIIPPGKYCSLTKQEAEKGYSCLSLRFTAAGKALLPARDHSAAGSATCCTAYTTVTAATTTCCSLMLLQLQHWCCHHCSDIDAAANHSAAVIPYYHGLVLSGLGGGLGAVELEFGAYKWNEMEEDHDRAIGVINHWMLWVGRNTPIYSASLPPCGHRFHHF